MQDPGCRGQDFEFRIANLGMHDPGSTIQDAGYRRQIPAGSWQQKIEVRTSEVRASEVRGQTANSECGFRGKETGVRSEEGRTEDWNIGMMGGGFPLGPSIPPFQHSNIPTEKPCAVSLEPCTFLNTGYHNFEYSNGEMEFLENY